MNGHRFSAVVLAALAGSTLLLSASAADAAIAGPLAPATWRMVAAGSGHTCGIQTNGSLWCWGDNAWGQVGNGAASAPVPTPVQVLPGTKWRSVTVGALHSCAIENDGSLWCWGSNAFGQVGTGSATLPNPDPLLVDASGATWTSVSGGAFFTCAIRSDGTLWCWGNNSFGQLGIGTTSPPPTPGPIQVGTDATWASVSAGGVLACGVKTDQTLWCWGDNSFGELGDGTLIGEPAPIQVGVGTTWASVSAGGAHACAIQSDHTLWCWGYNSNGQLGNGDTTNRPFPTQVTASKTWSSVAARLYHTCAIRTDHTLWCWGDNSWGQLGIGSNVDAWTPSQVSAGTTWASAAGGYFFACGIQTGRTLWCWGANDSGQLGDGLPTDSWVPVQVS